MLGHIAADNEHPDADRRGGAHAQSGRSGIVIDDCRTLPVDAHLVGWSLEGAVLGQIVQALVSDFDDIRYDALLGQDERFETIHISDTRIYSPFGLQLGNPPLASHDLCIRLNTRTQSGTTHAE